MLSLVPLWLDTMDSFSGENALTVLLLEYSGEDGPLGAFAFRLLALVPAGNLEIALRAIGTGIRGAAFAMGGATRCLVTLVERFSGSGVSETRGKLLCTFIGGLLTDLMETLSPISDDVVGNVAVALAALTTPTDIR